MMILFSGECIASIMVKMPQWIGENFGTKGLITLHQLITVLVAHAINMFKEQTVLGKTLD